MLIYLPDAYARVLASDELDRAVQERAERLTLRLAYDTIERARVDLRHALEDTEVYVSSLSLSVMQEKLAVLDRVLDELTARATALRTACGALEAAEQEKAATATPEATV